MVFSAYCAVNIVSAAMCGQNSCPLNFDESNCLVFMLYPCGCLFVCPFGFMFFIKLVLLCLFYFVAEAPQFCSYLSWDCNCYLTNTLQIDFSSNKGAKNVCFSVERLGVRKAVVANPRRDTCSREVFRHEVIFFFFFVKKGEIAFAFLL